MKWVDTHAHLDFPDFDKDRDELLRLIHSMGIEYVFVPGIARDRWHKLFEICQLFSSTLKPLVGLHPALITQHKDEDLIWMMKVLNEDQVYGVGEIGLDFHDGNASQKQQEIFFVKQLEMAKHFSLPIVLHVRKAHQRVLEILKEMKWNLPGIVHAYSGSLEEANEYLKLRLRLGVGGSITWPNAKKIKQVVGSLPLDSFVFETDSPDIQIFGEQTKRNTPINLLQIIKQFEELRRSQFPAESLETIAAITYKNVEQIFSLTQRELRVGQVEE